MIYDPRMPARDVCVVGALLDKWTIETPDKTFLVFDDDEEWSFAETRRKVRRAAGAFQKLGVRHGDHVLSWQPNGKEALLTWLGLNYLGAVYVPINTAYKGGLLEHVVVLSDAKLMVCHAQLLPRLADVDIGDLREVIVTCGEGADVKDLKLHDAVCLNAADEVDPEQDVQPWDTQYIIFTSGTTGPSKAVLSSYVQTWSMGVESGYYYDGSDRILVNLPLFHVGGTLFIASMLSHGGSCLLVDGFKTDEFWPLVRRHNVTGTCLVGAMTPFLLKAPASNQDKEHSLRRVVTIPWNEDSLALAKRYGFDMYTVFNMTEICAPIVSEANPEAIGTCGKLRPGMEARVVDENDCEVAPGVVGELIVRADRPWSLNHGYYKNPEATAIAWRNGWFHTGDAMKYDEDGNYFFVDRIKDAIRRRGENISSFEVESEVTQFGDVAEAAAIPVPSEFTEDDVMVVVAPVPGRSIDPVALFHFLQPRMAHFMLPRYIRVMDDLPKTPTQKVQKNLLRDDGITIDTWDREAAGIKIKREKLA